MKKNGITIKYIESGKNFVIRSGSIKKPPLGNKDVYPNYRKTIHGMLLNNKGGNSK